MAKLIWGLVMVLGIVIHAGCRPEVPPEEVIQLELERVEEIIEEDEKIKVLLEEVICPDKEEKINRLIRDLRDEDSEIRRNAANALGEIGDPRAVGSLIAVLRDEDRWVRRNAARALGEIGDPGAVESLIVTLGDEDRWVRWGAVRALGEIRDPRAVEPLLASLKDEDMHIQWAAVVVLEQMTGKPFGEDPIKWQEWWEENKEDFLKER